MGSTWTGFRHNSIEKSIPFISLDFTEVFKEYRNGIFMDGKGRWTGRARRRHTSVNSQR